MIVLTYILLCMAVGWIAKQKGRSSISWFFLSIILSPLLGFLAIAIIPSQEKTNISLESQVRDNMLEAQFSSYIRSHKPAFSATIVYDVASFGERRRFKTKADAISYCMTQLEYGERSQAITMDARERQDYEARVAQIEPRRFDD